MSQFTVYPDCWEIGRGHAPTLGPIEAPTAHAAYHAARTRGLYPAGVVCGLRVVKDTDPSGPVEIWTAAREARAHAPSR